ncbi:sialidase family protein [Pseudooceanicola sp.]|uniref:sialidase family protein n=1 Tax=Pseudooceanicola sp. TaxID=1914328 RepID=UPI003517B3FE
MSILPVRTVVRGNPPSPDHQIDPVQLAALLEYILEAALLKGPIYFKDTRAELLALTGVEFGASGFVLHDGGLSGVYRYNAGWTKTAELPSSYTDPVPQTIGIASLSLQTPLGSAIEQRDHLESFTGKYALYDKDGRVALEFDPETQTARTEYPLVIDPDPRPITVKVPEPASVLAGGAEYVESGRVYQATATITRAGSRLFCAWRADNNSAGENTDNYLVVAISDDEGVNWEETNIVTYPDVDTRQMIDPMLWTDPEGAVWLIYCVCSGDPEAHDSQDGQLGSWATVCSNPQADPQRLVWSQPFRLTWWGDVRQPKKIAGEWYVALDMWRSSADFPPIVRGWAGGHFCKFDWRNKKVRRISKLPPNNGSEWSGFFETEFVELSDGRIMATCRWVDPNLLRCFSSDGGLTWTPWESWVTVVGPTSSSRIWLGHSDSGRMLLAYNADEIRRSLTIAIFSDDGDTIEGSIEIDPATAASKSYPIVCTDGAGTIWIAYDVGRTVQAEIRVGKVTEAEVLASGTTHNVYTVSAP